MAGGHTTGTTLVEAYREANQRLDTQIVAAPAIFDRVVLVARNLQNRAGVRALLACLLAKIDRPEVDIRKPYTNIGSLDSYSGRHYDERYVTAFINTYQLPCNPTTAFLTPALRNRDIVLTPDINLVGRPKNVYDAFLQLLTDVQGGEVGAYDLLLEAIRQLVLFKRERDERMASLMAGLRTVRGGVPLSSEGIVRLVEQHLRFRQANVRGTSRLPVIIVAAAYQVAAPYLGERARPLESHNAADEQTGALGDVEVTLVADSQIITSYEMKMKIVTKEDVDRALQKLTAANLRVDNYIFITTEPIDRIVQDYASKLYEETGGIEFVILDCIGFLRHFLHLFHRSRAEYLDAYQALMLQEPESAISQPIKEAFLAMRQASESGD